MKRYFDIGYGITVGFLSAVYHMPSGKSNPYLLHIYRTDRQYNSSNILWVSKTGIIIGKK